MRGIRICLTALLMIVVAALPCHVRGQQAQKLDRFALERAHLMLQSVYDEVHDHYYDPTFHDVDLKAAYHKYDKIMDSAQLVNATFRVIAAFLQELHDSHTFFMPPQRVNPSTPGFAIEMVGDQCFVTRIRPGSDAAKKLHVGDQVLALDGYKVTRQDYDPLYYFIQILSPSPTETVAVRSPDGAVRQETVQSMWRSGKAVLNLFGADGGDFWNIVREGEQEDHLNRERTTVVDDVLIWKMPSFVADQDMVDSAISKARKHKALVLDLRGNPGGAVDTLKRMISKVFDHPVPLYTEVSRKESKKETVKPKGSPFTGKLIVLVDSRSASAAELFARVIQLEHRGEVIGDRSSGMVMEARHYGESLGMGISINYGVSITSANLLMSDGKSIEHVGVTPDELMLPTAQDLAAGRDPVMSHAVALAGAKLDPVAAGKLFPFEWPRL